MRFLMLFLTANSGLAAPATPITDCPTQVIAIAGWQNHPQDQLQCIKVSPEFIEGLKYLCSADQKSLSPQYAKYRSYEISYKDEMAEGINATDPAEKSDHFQKARVIERDWNIFGFRGEVSQSLNLIDSVEYSCSSQSH